MRIMMRRMMAPAMKTKSLGEKRFREVLGDGF